jgi:hypothetical protein
MWERAIGIAPDPCRPDVPDLTEAQLASVEIGMTSEEVLWLLGQPHSRTDSGFSYCMADQRTGTIGFSADGLVATVGAS